MAVTDSSAPSDYSFCDPLLRACKADETVWKRGVEAIAVGPRYRAAPTVHRSAP